MEGWEGLADDGGSTRSGLVDGAGSKRSGLVDGAGSKRRRGIVREVLFFPEPLTCTEEVLSPGLRCMCPLPHKNSALQRLMRRLLEARSSVALCVFTFSCPPLARAVLMLHNRGVRVRVITDRDYIAAPGSQIGALRKE
ncbi:PREDICTED: mitochondrial cardiolipin hydrolase-like, partial [Nanorana parkeri]|uniref:mitochondrial cardiolipin hydrolase-like n=1 Tax=Nanorana parkeri TaxID=125878 RepID=UPI000854A3F5